MTKSEIHKAFIGQLSLELESITNAAKSTFATATDEAHHAEGKYDTFSLESSYLARGQAKRVEEISTALDRLQMLPLKEFSGSDPILLSALIRLQTATGERRTLFLGPAAGGETINIDGEEIMMITSASPMGQAVINKKVGDSFSLEIGPQTQHLTVLSVE